MIKTKSITILFISLALMSVMAISLIGYFTGGAEKLSETVIVEGDGVVDKTLSVSSLTLNPGEEVEYEILLKSEIDGSFTVSLDFIEMVDGGLNSFVNVEISSNDNAVHDGTLRDLLSSTAISFEEILDAKAPVKIKITYKMPVETGNEAQGTTASFNIRLIIQKSAV